MMQFIASENLCHFYSPFDGQWTSLLKYVLYKRTTLSFFLPKRTFSSTYVVFFFFCEASLWSAKVQQHKKIYIADNQFE